MVPLLFLLFVPLSQATLSCKDLNGKDVDWFMAYKLPGGLKDSPEGRSFYYLDKANPTWTLSTEPIESEKSAIGATVEQVFDGKDTLFWAMYNDDPPDTDKGEAYRGHIKGVLGFNSDNGFWIQHSMPNFPPNPKSTTDNKYGYPDTATKFGQTLICLSMKTADLNTIIEQLRYMQISPYGYNIPADMAAKYVNLTSVIADRTSLNTRKEKVYTSTKTLKTAGGQEFTSFAKHKNFKADVWMSLIAVEDGIPMSVESWLNGAAKNLDSTCSADVTVHDISSIDLNGNAFKSTMDHSKWGMSDADSKPIICIGDMNRQASQMARGGGALCIENSKVWKTWKGIIASTKPC